LGRLDAGQVLEIVVDRLDRAGRGIAQQGVAALLELARIERDAKVERRLQVGLHRAEHGETARHMEAADRDRQAGRPQRPGDVEGAGELVALHADQKDETEIAVPPEAFDDLLRPDPGVDLVERIDVDVDVIAQHPPLARLVDQAVDGRQRVRGNERPEPLDDVTVVVVVRRLDQRDLETAIDGLRRHRHAPSRKAARHFTLR
jgi:hypothetical protein